MDAEGEFRAAVKVRIEQEHLDQVEYHEKWLDKHPEVRAEEILSEGRAKLTYAIRENKPLSVERAYEMITGATEWLYANYFADSHVV